ncbi:MAG: acyl carrier protein [Erysipelotrichaceae bacterium]|nr:acyl carrier protein [Erysipelotrichaceae bacterium]
MELYDEVVGIIINKVADIKHLDVSELNEDSNLQEEINVRSGEMVAVISALEDEYDVYIDIMKLRKCPLVKDVANFVVGLIEG